jgi:pilus assembly protein CpaB
MRAKSVALLMLALGCGLVASIGITQVLANRNVEPSNRTGDTVPIYVALKDISLGDALSAELVKQEPWPKDKIQGAITKIEDIEGRRTRQKLFAGEPIMENKLLGKGASAQGASSVIPKGYRVVAVKVDSVSGSGLILPGDRVDVLVYLVGNSQKDILETSTRTVLQDIKVFAVNDVIDMEDEKDPKGRSVSAKTISLLVTPAQAAKVTLASEMGKIRLVMRSPEDNTHYDDASAKPEELFGRSAFANRTKEASGNKPDDNKAGILEFLTQMKAKAPVKQTQETRPAVTWLMRILQPEGVNDIVLESDNTAGPGNADSGLWKISSSGITSFNNAGKTPAQLKKNPVEKKPDMSSNSPPDSADPLNQNPTLPSDSSME